MRKDDRLITNFMLFSIVIGFLLRLYFLFERDFWFDEAFTFFIAKLPIKQILPAVLTDNNPPFYYLLMHFVVKFSQSPAILRLPSFLVNIGSAYFLYKVAARLADKKAAVYAVAFFSLSPLTIYLAHTARLHALGLFFLTVILFAFLQLIANPTRTRKVFFFTVSLLGVYTHYYIALLFIPLSIWIYTKHSHALKKSWFLFLILISGSFLPWFMVQKMLGPAICSCPPTHLALPATLASSILGGIGEVSIRRYFELPWPIILFLGSVTIFNVYLFWKGLQKSRLLAYLYVIPLIVISITGLVLPTFSPKGFSIYSSVFLALVALEVSKQKNSKMIAIINILFLFIINVIHMTDPFFSGTPIRPIVEVLKQSADIPIAHMSSITYYSTKFYLLNQPQILLTTNPYSERTRNYLGSKQTLEMVESQYWLVDTKSWVNVDERRSQLEYVNNHFEILKEFFLSEVSVKLVKRK